MSYTFSFSFFLKDAYCDFLCAERACTRHVAKHLQEELYFSWYNKQLKPRPARDSSTETWWTRLSGWWQVLSSSQTSSLIIRTCQCYRAGTWITEVSLKWLISVLGKHKFTLIRKIMLYQIMWLTNSGLISNHNI